MREILKLLCVNDYHNEEGVRIFTKGKEYKGTRRHIITINGEEQETLIPVLRVVNDISKWHLIEDKYNGEYTDYFNNYFSEIV